MLDRLARVQAAWTLVAAGIGSVFLCGWLIPAAGRMLFPGWSLMKANTALLVLLCAASLHLSRSNLRTRSRGRIQASRILAAIVVLVAATVLAEYIGHRSFGIDTLLASDHGSPVPGRMSPQTASAFLLLGLVMLLIRVTDGALSVVVDGLLFLLCPLLLVVSSGYLFGVMGFFGVSPSTRTAPHTLLALMMLSLAAVARRAESSLYSILTGPGMGGKIARMAAPVALIGPFILEAVRYGVAQRGVLSPQDATASVTTLAAVVGALLILGLAWRIDSLQQEIGELSLRDDLTRLYNRRGLFLLAERELHLARRSGVPFSVLFIDLDGLKKVNDTLGHEAGSDSLREMAALIGASFRDADVIARIGGDEFVVAGAASEAGMAQALERLEASTTALNHQPDRRYPLEFSAGMATFNSGPFQSLESLIDQADLAMYAAKQSKDSARRPAEFERSMAD